MKGLAAGHRNLCVVGDDDQSIYGWRGAEVQHILSFQKDWPEAKLVRLEENYRSTAAILNYANTLIAFNRLRHEKVLRAARPNGQSPRVMQLRDENDEAEKVVADIQKQLSEPGVRAQDFAILCRTNEQPRVFETELRRAKLPYVLLGGMSFFDRKEVKDLLAYLKLIANPQDESSLLRIINTPPRNIGASTVKQLLAKATAQGCTVWDILPAHAHETTTKFQQLILSLQKIARKASLVELISDVIAQTGYRQELERQYPDPNDREARTASIEEIINAASLFDVRKKRDSLLEDFLDDIALGTRDTSDDKENQLQNNAIALMTLHSAKGLEFPFVYMVGMEEGILPHKRSVEIEGDAIDEERRLCYVGVTRAQEKLTLSFALGRRKWGKLRDTIPSRFLYEMTGQAENIRKRGSNRSRSRNAV